jgi:antitoxin CptB
MSEINNSHLVNNIAKLQWACRRGMLELDLILGKFLRESYADLPLEDKELFVELLSCQDPSLFSWLLGSEQPEDANMAKITGIIRSHVRSRV